MAKLEIKYRNVPKEILSDFEEKNFGENISIELVKDDRMYFNASGGPNDILFLFDISFTELIVTGVIYDVITYPIKSAWKNLVAHYKTYKHGIRDNNQITLKFEINEKNEVHFHLEGNISDESIDNAVIKLAEFLKNREYEKTEIKSTFVAETTSSKPRIRIRFNRETGTWEPVNNDLKKYFKDALDDASKNSPD